MLTRETKCRLIDAFCTGKVCHQCPLDNGNEYQDLPCSDEERSDVEIDLTFSTLLSVLTGEALPVKTQSEDIRYICDRRACEVCDPDCRATKDIRHAKNFELMGRIMVEVERGTPQAYTI